MSVLSAPFGSQVSTKSDRLATIFSPKSVKQHTLPRFLRDTPNQPSSRDPLVSRPSDSGARLHGAEEMAQLCVSLGSFQVKSLMYVPSDRTDRSPVVSKSLKAQREAQQRNIIEAVVRGEQSTTPVLWIDQEGFSYNDLSPLLHGHDPCRRLMQAFFTYLNRGNKSLRGIDRVKILRIPLVCEILTHRKDNIQHLRSSPLQYE